MEPSRTSTAEEVGARPPPASAQALSRPGVVSLPGILRTNPYQRLLYDALAHHGLIVVEGAGFKLGWLWASRHTVGYLHFHWPQSYWRHERGPAALRKPLTFAKLALFGARLYAARALGYRVAWTVHQVLPHEVASRRIDLAGARILATASNVLIVHDRWTLASATELLGRAGARANLVLHGPYIGIYPAGRSRSVVRAELGLDDKSFVFLCLGDLRGYKDVDALLRAFGQTSRADVALVVAGSVGDENLRRATSEAAETDVRLRPLLGFVPTERIAELYGASDAAVIARGDGGTSGSLILALSLGVPVVVARRSTYVELAGDAAIGVFEPSRDASLRDALEQAAALTPAELAAAAAVALRQATQADWRAIGERTAVLLIGP